MMRALEYAVRLGFSLEAGTAAAIERNRYAIRTVSGARLNYELFEGLRSGAAAGIVAAWRSVGLFDLAYPNLRCDGPSTARLLEAIDQGIRARVPYADASWWAPSSSRFLQGAEMATDGQRLDNVELLQRLHDMLEPTAAGLHLSNHTVHLLHHGLFTLTKMARAPARPAGRQAEPTGLLPGGVAAARPGRGGRSGSAGGAHSVGACAGSIAAGRIG
jgi:tRNA nucleotidyltransferase/poly(A) polymerase